MSQRKLSFQTCKHGWDDNTKMDRNLSGLVT